MKPQNLHAHEDRLLDFAYGELPSVEARAVESHLEGCAKCTEALAGIRGVRSTMSQLSLEPAPDAGLDSLLAYAQQAARNAAAGPPPKATWWRRWMLPVMGVAGIAAFGVVSLQVSKSVNLAPDFSAQEAQAVAMKAEPSPVASPTPPPAAAYPVESKQLAMAEADDVSPPPPAPAVKLDTSGMQKDFGAPAKAKPSRSKRSADWSNAGSTAGLSRDDVDGYAEKNLQGWDATQQKKEYDRRDAMTQSGAFPKPKPMAVGSGSTAPSTPTARPAPAAPPPPPEAQAPMDEEASASDALTEAVPAAPQEERPEPSALRVGGGRSANREPVTPEAAQPSQLASLEGAKGLESRRQQSPRRAESAAPAESPGGAAEREAPSRAELSKMAFMAKDEGDRFREVSLLRQALASGATGSERLSLLNRLCDAEFELGRRQSAIQACNQVMVESPSSGAAQVARRRLAQEIPDAPKASKKAASNAASDADAQPAPASAAPAPAH